MPVTMYHVVNEGSSTAENPIAGRLYLTIEAAQRARDIAEGVNGRKFSLRVEGIEVEDLTTPFVVAEDWSIEPLYEEMPRYDTILTADHRIVAINPDSTMWDEDGVPEFVQDWNGTWYADCDVAYYVGTDEDITTDVLLEAWGLGVKVPVHIGTIGFTMGDLYEQGGIIVIDEEDVEPDFATVPVSEYSVPADIDGYGNPVPTTELTWDDVQDMTETGCFECDAVECPANPANPMFHN